jgi:cell division protein FtsB
MMCFHNDCIHFIFEMKRPFDHFKKDDSFGSYLSFSFASYYLSVSKEVLDLREENKRLKESEKRAKEEVKRAQDILLQAGAIIVDEPNDGDDQHKPGTKATTRSLLAVQELRNNNEGLEDKVKNFEEGIDKAKKVLEQAWAIVI